MSDELPRQCEECGVKNRPEDVFQLNGKGWATNLEETKDGVLCRKCRGDWPFCEGYPPDPIQRPSLPSYAEMRRAAVARQVRRLPFYPVPFRRAERVEKTYNFPPGEAHEPKWQVWRYEPNDAHTWAFVHYCKRAGHVVYVKGNQRRVHVGLQCSRSA